MPKKHVAGFVFALADIVLGALALLFFSAGSLVLPPIAPLPPLSTPFLISLALPAFVLLAGIANLLRSSYSPALTFFVSFLVAVNSLTALLEPAPPYFLKANAPSVFALAFHYLVPAAAIGYFALHSLFTFIATRKNKTAEGAAGSGTPPPRREMFCATCQAPLAATDEVCPSCGALIRGWRCPACGYEGRRRDFQDDRCPRCGREQKFEEED